MKKILSAIMAMGLLVSCSDNDNKVPEEQFNQVPIDVLEAQASEDTVVFTRNESDINEALNEFSGDLLGIVSTNYKSIYSNSESENFSVSPLGVFLCMGLVANTSDDNSANAIAKVFKYTNIDEMNSVCSKLIKYLPNKNNGAEMSLANSAWIANQIAVPTDYASNINSIFNAEVYNADFSDSKTLDLINSWCAIKTNNKIEHFLNKLDPSTVAMLINALYYEGQWNSKFDKDITTKEVFNGTQKSTKVDMMHKETGLDYIYNDKCYGVSLPLENAKVEMAFLMPKDDNNFDSFVNGFDHTTIESLRKMAMPIKLSLPKFEIEQEGFLQDVLESLGMPMHVTLSKLNTSIGCYLIIKQNTYTGIDEEGATAAASTAASAMMADVGGVSATTITFNRPFVFFIRNVETGTILMAGRVCNIE